MIAIHRCPVPRSARVLHLILLAALLVSPLKLVTAAHAAPAQFDPLTIGAVLGTAYLTKDLTKSLMDGATGDVLKIFQGVSDAVGDIITKLETGYGQMLDVTVDRMDDETRKMMIRLNSILQHIQVDLEVGLDKLNETILADLQTLTNDLRATLAQAQDTVTITIWGTALLVDKAAFNLAFIVGIVLFLVVLLVLLVLLFTRQLPKDPLSRAIALLLIALFLAASALLLIPQTRAYALTWTGNAQSFETLGTEPLIFEVRPSTLIIGKNKEINIIGARLAREGKLPTVEIAGLNAEVQGGNEWIVAKVYNLDLSSRTGAQTIRLRSFDNQEKTASITIQGPRPRPAIISLTLTPVGKVWESGGDVTGRAGCTADIPGVPGLFDDPWRTNSCNFDVEIRLTLDYVVDTTRPAVLSVPPGLTSSLNNTGSANAGFAESVYSYWHRLGNGDAGDGWPVRTVDFITNPMTQEPIGIHITGSAQSDSWADTRRDKSKGEIYADYTVFGRRKVAGSGTTWRLSGPCEISGQTICGTYNLPGLDGFIEGYQFLVTVTFVDATGGQVANSDTLIPNDPSTVLLTNLYFEDANGSPQLISVPLRIIGNDVVVAGP